MNPIKSASIRVQGAYAGIRNRAYRFPCPCQTCIACAHTHTHTHSLEWECWQRSMGCMRQPNITETPLFVSALPRGEERLGRSYGFSCSVWRRVLCMWKPCINNQLLHRFTVGLISLVRAAF